MTTPTMCRVLIVISFAFLTFGCSRPTRVADLQAVFGPREAVLAERELAVDLNSDGKAERLVLLFGGPFRRDVPRRTDEALGGLVELSQPGVILEGLAVFDGVRPNVPVFYQYNEYRYQLRLDTIEGRRVLVSDSGRDHVQYVWGWWPDDGDWPPGKWKARQRVWNQREEKYGPWIEVEKIAVVIGKTMP